MTSITLLPTGNEGGRRLVLPSNRFPPIPKSDCLMVEAISNRGCPFRRFCYKPTLTPFSLLEESSVLLPVDDEDTTTPPSVPVHAAFLLQSISTPFVALPLHFGLFTPTTTDRIECAAEWCKLIYGYRQCSTSNLTTWRPLVGTSDYSRDPTGTFGEIGYPLEAFCRLLWLVASTPAPRGRAYKASRDGSIKSVVSALETPPTPTPTENKKKKSEPKKRRRPAKGKLSNKTADKLRRKRMREAQAQAAVKKEEEDSSDEEEENDMDEEDEEDKPQQQPPPSTKKEQPLSTGTEVTTAECLVQFICTALFHRFITCRGRWLERWYDKRPYTYRGIDESLKCENYPVDHLHPAFVFILFRNHDIQHTNCTDAPSKPHIYTSEQDFLNAVLNESSNVFYILLTNLIHTLLDAESRLPSDKTRWLEKLGLRKFVLEKNGLSGWTRNTWNYLETARFSELPLWAPSEIMSPLPKPTADDRTFHPRPVSLAQAISDFTAAHMQHVGTTISAKAKSLQAKAFQGAAPSSVSAAGLGERASVVFSVAHHDQNSGHSDGMTIERNTLVFENNCRRIQGSAFDPDTGKTLPTFELNRSHVPQLFTHLALGPEKAAFAILRPDEQQMLAASDAAILSSEVGVALIQRFMTCLCWFSKRELVKRIVTRVRTIRVPGTESELSLLTHTFPLVCLQDPPASPYTYLFNSRDLYYPQPTLWSADFQSPMYLRNDTLVSMAVTGSVPFATMLASGEIAVDTAFFARRGVHFLIDNIYCQLTEERVALREDIIAELNAPFLLPEEHITLFEVGRRVVQAVASWDGMAESRPIVRDIHVWWVYQLLWTLCDTEQDVYTCLMFLLLPDSDWEFLQTNHTVTQRIALLLVALQQAALLRYHEGTESLKLLRSVGMHPIHKAFQPDNLKLISKLALKVSPSARITLESLKHHTKDWSCTPCALKINRDSSAFVDAVEIAFGPYSALKNPTKFDYSIELLQLWLYSLLHRKAFLASLQCTGQVVAHYDFSTCIPSTTAPLRHMFADVVKILSKPEYHAALSNVSLDTLAVHPMYVAVASAMLAFTKASLAVHGHVPFAKLAAPVAEHLSSVVTASFVTQQEKAARDSELARSVVDTITRQASVPSEMLLDEIRKAGHLQPTALLRFIGKAIRESHSPSSVYSTLQRICRESTPPTHPFMRLWNRNFSGFMNVHEPGWSIIEVAIGSVTSSSSSVVTADDDNDNKQKESPSSPHSKTLSALSSLLASTGVSLSTMLQPFRELDIALTYDMFLSSLGAVPFWNTAYQFPPIPATTTSAN